MTEKIIENCEECGKSTMREARDAWFCAECDDGPFCEKCFDVHMGTNTIKITNVLKEK
jgi:hypothetical protein